MKRPRIVKPPKPGDLWYIIDMAMKADRKP